MAKTVRDIMTTQPVSLESNASVVQAAAAMRDFGIGTVVVMQNGAPCGIVTDRDITVRTVATGSDPSSTRLGDICSKTVAAVRPDQSVDDAVQMMKSHDIKRVLVMQDDKLEGIVSLGDLTARGEAGDVLEDLSESDPNN